MDNFPGFVISQVVLDTGLITAAGESDKPFSSHADIFRCFQSEWDGQLGLVVERKETKPLREEVAPWPMSGLTEIGWIGPKKPEFVGIDGSRGLLFKMQKNTVVRVKFVGATGKEHVKYFSTLS